MKYGRFIDADRAFEITTPVTPTTWRNVLFNDAYCMEVSQTLQGESRWVEDYRQEALTTGYRYFYVLDHESKRAFNPNYVPLRRELECFSCVHGVNYTELTSECDGIRCVLRVTVPPKGMCEVWRIGLENLSGRVRDLSLFSAFGLLDGGTMGGECVYDAERDVLYRYAFPYHVYYEDKAKVESKPSYYYLMADRRPDSCDMSEQRFWGSEDRGELPEALKRGMCGGFPGEAETFCGAMQHRFALKPGQRVTLCLRLGAASTVDELAALRGEWSADRARTLETGSDAYWQGLIDQFSVETPDEDLNAFANFWLKKQIVQLTRLNRGGVYCPVRNQLQDAMGYALVDPEGAKRFVWHVLKRQERGGFIRQWYMTDGSPDRALCLLRHTDGPLWLVMAAVTLINQCGDAKLYETPMPFIDGGEAPVREHLLRAVRWMYDHRGSHGLCLMGDGDWTDPVNGAGRKGRGESTWSTLALIYCVKLLLSALANVLKPSEAGALFAMRVELTDCVNRYCWAGDRYVAGFDDNGVAFGSPEDNNRLFLNAQTWAILAGVPDAERLKTLEATLRRLETPFGPLLLDPPFDGWDPRWGRISIKKSGTTENGSVYCHASMFKAYSDAARGDGDALYDVIRRTLPTNPDNPPESNLQLPTYVPNYYYALKGSPNYGRSSGNSGTGTVGWMLQMIVEQLLGVRATARGIRLRPCLPEKWQSARCTRRFRDAVYHVTIERGEPRCTVDGQPFFGDDLPYDPGREYDVRLWV